jgi:pyruvate/2-oxoglutarate dehydrogenase complex dihydrolipoamide acyltransferase (E2) component
MPVPVAVPKLGNRMRAGVVSEWYQPDGAAVQSGDLVCCLECDFVAVDIEADGDGILRHRVEAGLVRPPGDLLGVVLARGERMPPFEPVDLDAPFPEPADDPDVPPAGTVALRPAAWQEPRPPQGAPGSRSEHPGRRNPSPDARVEHADPVLRTHQPAPVADIVKAIATSPDFASAPVAEDLGLSPHHAAISAPTEPAGTSQQATPDDLAESGELTTDEPDSNLSPADGRAKRQSSDPVVPLAFPKRFASFELEPPGDGLWEPDVPGDSTDFASALMPVPRDAILEAHVDPRSPGDNAEHSATAESTELADWLKSEPAPRPAAPTPSAEAPQYAWAAWEADTQASAANARVLGMSVTAALGEAHKMREQLGREWRVQRIRPSTEDIVVRAVARAFRDLPGQWSGSVALRTLTDGAEFTRVLPGAASRPFRDAVLAMQAAGPGSSDCVVTSHAGDGVESATPRLRGECVLAVALGAERQAPSWEGDRWAPSTVATISISYDSAALADGVAGRFIARVRELVESPYALLAD